MSPALRKGLRRNENKNYKCRTKIEYFVTTQSVCSRYNLAMLARALLGLIIILEMACAAAQSQDTPSQAPPAAPSSVIVDYAPPVHSFWDRENILLFSGVAVFRGLDFASTKNFERRGRQEVLIPDDVVNNSAGFAALEAAGTATSIGISYIFHRTGHHKMERWLSIGHIGVTAFGVAWNYSLKTTRPK
jgi:hypothetical protein